MWQDQAVRLPRRSEKTLYSGDEMWRWEQCARQRPSEVNPRPYPDSERDALGEWERRGQSVRVQKAKRFGQELSLFHVSV